MKHWFKPVAAIRPYLFQKCFVLMVAMDLLVLMVERGGRYGLDVVPFNVPHFAWLHTVHRIALTQGIPTDIYYVTVLVITSFLAFVMFFTGHRPWLMAVVTLLYTYCWSMSRLDSYLHHYMITLIMACMVFFPAIDARQLRDGILDSVPSSRKSSIKQPSLANWAVLLAGLAVAYRTILSQAVGLDTMQRWTAMFVFAGLVGSLVFFGHRQLPLVGPQLESWAFRLLGATVGVIYVFTSIAKMDAEWCGGHTLRAVGTTANVLRPVEQLAAFIGLSSDLFWAGLATLVIPLELTLAVSYMLAVRQDEPDKLWIRRWSSLAWCLAVGLHLNNEMMNLIIQWFGYYMLLLATLILLPARCLLTLGCVFYWPESAARDRYDNWIKGLSSGRATIVLGLVSVFALFVLILSGFFIWIAGARVASCLLAAGLVMALILGMVLGWERRSIGLSLGASLAGLMLIAATAQSSMRFDYFDLRGKTLQQMGMHQRAIVEMNEALIFPSPSPAASAEVLTNLGLSYRRLNQPDEAEERYEQAIQLSDRAFLAHYSLANMLVELERYDEAVPHYQQAIAIKPDFSDAYVNLGSMLEFVGRTNQAIELYQKALVLEPNAADIQQLLEAARRRPDLGTNGDDRE